MTPLSLVSRESVLSELDREQSLSLSDESGIFNALRIRIRSLPSVEAPASGVSDAMVDRACDHHYGRHIWVSDSARGHMRELLEAAYAKPEKNVAESLLTKIGVRFKSGNSMPVERAHITRDEYEQLLAEYSAIPQGSGEAFAHMYRRRNPYGNGIWSDWKVALGEWEPIDEFDEVVPLYRHPPALVPAGGEAVAPKKLWPFVETPGAFADRLHKALIDFDWVVLSAVRHVLIENPAQIADYVRHPPSLGAEWTMEDAIKNIPRYHSIMDQWELSPTGSACYWTDVEATLNAAFPQGRPAAEVGDVHAALNAWREKTWPESNCTFPDCSCARQTMCDSAIPPLGPPQQTPAAEVGEENDECLECDGEGRVENTETPGEDSVLCDDCEGTGKRKHTAPSQQTPGGGGGDEGKLSMTEKQAARKSVALVVSTADAFFDAVEKLFNMRADGPCLAERQPSKDTECLLAFQALNDTGKRHRAVIDKLREVHAAPSNAIAPDEGEYNQSLDSVAQSAGDNQAPPEASEGRAAPAGEGRRFDPCPSPPSHGGEANAWRSFCSALLSAMADIVGLPIIDERPRKEMVDRSAVMQRVMRIRRAYDEYSRFRARHPPALASEGGEK